jgi:hypothetical protein
MAPVAGSYEYSNEILPSITGGEIIMQPGNYQLLKKDSVPVLSG